MTQTVTNLQEAPAIELGQLKPRRSEHDSYRSADVRQNNLSEFAPGVSSVLDNSVEARAATDEAPPHAQGEAERWNKPFGNVGRLAFAFLSFTIAGMNDAAIGVCIPLLPHVKTI